MRGRAKAETPRTSIMPNEGLGFAARKCASCRAVCGQDMSLLETMLAPPSYWAAHDRKAETHEPLGRRHGGKGSAVLEPPPFDRDNLQVKGGASPRRRAAPARGALSPTRPVARISTRCIILKAACRLARSTQIG